MTGLDPVGGDMKAALVNMLCVWVKGRTSGEISP